VPNKFITQNEIDAANQVHFDELNIQNQPKIVWPQNFVVARAYLDQLARGSSVSAQRIAAVNSAMAKAEGTGAKDDKELKALAAGLDKDAGSVKTPADAERMRAVAAILRSPKI
jgi:hypothetical protein